MSYEKCRMDAKWAKKSIGRGDMVRGAKKIVLCMSPADIDGKIVLIFHNDVILSEAIRNFFVGNYV